MKRKIHYIVKDTFSGCISSKLERIKFYTNEQDCIKDLKELRTNNTDKSTTYWQDFEWKSEIEKEYQWLFKNGFDIDILNNNLDLFKKIV